MFSILPASLSERFKTSAFVGSRTQSRRRKTTSGRMTFPYSDWL